MKTIKLIKFDLPINGTKVRNLDELRDNLTDEILTLARSSQLERWLRTRNLSDQADAIATIVQEKMSDKSLLLVLCKVLEVEAHPDDVSAIFDVPPAPGRFIPGARYFELYEALKNKLENLTVRPNEKNSTEKKISYVKFESNVFLEKSFKVVFDYVYGHKIDNVFLKQGSKVLKGSVVAEVKIGGFNRRISSPVNGYVEGVFFMVGDYVKVGSDLFSVVESEA